MTEITWKECKNKVLRMLLVQLSAYALLIAAAAVTLPGADPTAPRVVACLTLVCSLSSGRCAARCWIASSPCCSARPP